MEVNKRLAAIVVVIILIGAVAGYALFSLTENEDTNSDVRIGYLVGDLHQLSRVVAMNATVGSGQTLMQKNHLNVSTPNPTGYGNGGQVMDAFAADLIDVGYLGAPPALLKNINAGINITIVAQVNNEGSSIIVKSDINTFQDLDQKVVATPGVASIQHLLLMDLALENGMNLAQAGTNQANTVYWTQIAPVNQKAALEADTIQGAVGWEPYGSDSVLDGTAKVLNWSSELLPGHPCCVIAVKTSFLNEHRDIVEKLLTAHVQANEWIESAMANPESPDHELLFKMAEEFSNRNESVVANSLDHIILTYNITPEFEDGLKQFTQVMLDLDLITEAKMLERGYSSVDDFVSKVVDDSIINEVK